MSETYRRGPVLFWAVVVEGGLACIAALLGWLLGYPPWHYMGWEVWSPLRGAAVALPMLVMFLILVRYPLGPVRRIKSFVDEVVVPLFARCSLFDLAVISLLAGLGEEWLFRAVLQPVVGDWAGAWWVGWLVASLLFGLVHFITPTYALLAAGTGLYLGLVFHITQDVMDVALAHAFYDFAALVYLVRRKERRAE